MQQQENSNNQSYLKKKETGGVLPLEFRVYHKAIVI